MNKTPETPKEMREFLKTKNMERISLIMEKSGLSEEEKEYCLLRYKKKWNLTKVSMQKHTNISSISRKCTRGINQMLDFAKFCKNFSVNLELF
ncbi:MAG: hypothetical protein NC124_02265 [Clostridium sp.]|nr:hypothetical protein [Clostridium sp.]